MLVKGLSPILFSRLEALQEEFAEFRSESKPHQRIPIPLKAQTLDLIDAGVSISEIARACAIGYQQVRNWQGKAAPAIPPRILNVVESKSSPEISAGQVTRPQSIRVTIDSSRVVIDVAS